MNQPSTAFDQFVVQHSPRLQVIAALVTGSPEHGRDLVQDVLIRVLPRWDEIAALQDPFGYVRRCVLNAGTSWWRRFGREHLRATVDPGPAPDAPLVETQLVVHRALAGLSRSERACLVLRFYEDLTEAATAQELSMPVGTVKSTTHRALAKLRIDPDIRALVPEAN